MTFSDEPDFVISGVTDWTAVGGHGSDATLRTSEDLARATSALKDRNAPVAPSLAAEENELRAALSSAPRSLSANLDLGKYLVRTNAYARALPLLEAASAISHQGSESEYYLALACYKLHDSARATPHIQRALAQTDAADYQALAGEIAETQGDAYAAVQHMQHATRLEPTEEHYFAWGSELLLHRAVLQAAEIFVQGANAYPSSARMQTGWGSALFAEGHYDDAAQRLCRAADLQPREDAPYLLLGKVDEAAPAPLPCVQERLAKFLQLSPRNAEAHYLYGMALLRRGGNEARTQAEKLFLEAAKLNPSQAEALLQLGIIAAARQEYPQAISFYQNAISADPTLAEAHYRLAVAYDRTGLSEKAAAERSLHRSIKLKDAEAIEQERQKVKQFLVTLQQPRGPGLAR